MDASIMASLVKPANSSAVQLGRPEEYEFVHKRVPSKSFISNFTLASSFLSPYLVTPFYMRTTKSPIAPLNYDSRTFTTISPYRIDGPTCKYIRQC